MKVSISKGNSKMGLIQSVSLPPVITCACGCTCASKCYANKLCRIYPSVRKAYNNNLEVLQNDPVEYFNQVKKACAGQRFFRWHVSGDIPNMSYFENMVRLAKELPHTTFLCFTKKYDLVNWYLRFDVIPDNLKVIFSEWHGMIMENPHNMPTSRVIFKGETEPDDAFICPGNCLECAINSVGCWALKPGETVAFHEH